MWSWRVLEMMNVKLLAPDIQEALLFLRRQPIESRFASTEETVPRDQSTRLELSTKSPEKTPIGGLGDARGRQPKPPKIENCFAISLAWEDDAQVAITCATLHIQLQDEAMG